VYRNKKAYMEACRYTKNAIAEIIVNEIRDLDPPGRFLQRNEAGDWYDVGDLKAINKTKQVLREFEPRESQEYPEEHQERQVSLPTNSIIANEAPSKTKSCSEGDRKLESMPARPVPSKLSSDAGVAEAIVRLKQSEVGNMGDQRNLKRPLGQVTNNCLPSPNKKTRSDTEDSQGYRRCVPLQGPIPPKFQGNIKDMQQQSVPEFHCLANFQDLQAGYCTMCGHARPKKGTKGATGAVIPPQNKGVCTECDVKVWVVLENDLQVKWCKGCKNFRLWASFGEKGHTSKCFPCRDYQAHRYRLQKALEVSTI
jgi:hypothetical protein